MINRFVDVLGTGLDNIKTVYDFIDKEDHEVLLAFLNDVASKKPNGISHYKSSGVRYGGFSLPANIREIASKYKTKIIKVAEELYSTEFEEGVLAGVPVNFVIHSIGSSTPPHTDILENPDSRNRDIGIGNWRDAWDGYLACNLYINDNYSEGQVSFPEIDYEFKPVARSLVLWAGNKNYIHSVKDPVSADRYTGTTWIKFKDFDKYN